MIVTGYRMESDPNTGAPDATAVVELDSAVTEGLLRLHSRVELPLGTARALWSAMGAVLREIDERLGPDPEQP